MDEEAMRRRISKDSTFVCYEVLQGDDIALRVTCSTKETRNLEESPENDEENRVTHQKLSHGYALVYIEVLINYLQQEDESTPTEKMVLRNLDSKIR